MRRQIIAAAVSCSIVGALGVVALHETPNESGEETPKGSFEAFEQPVPDLASARQVETRPSTAVRSYAVASATPDPMGAADGPPLIAESRLDPPSREELQERFDERVEAFEKTFDDEPKDIEWAHSTELESFVSAWPGVDVRALECRSSVCRADVDLGTPEDAESFVSGFARPPLDGRMHLVPIDPSDELAVAFYYERVE